MEHKIRDTLGGVPVRILVDFEVEKDKNKKVKDISVKVTDIEYHDGTDWVLMSDKEKPPKKKTSKKKTPKKK